MKFDSKDLFSIDPDHVSRVRLAVGLMCLIGAFSNFFSDPVSLTTGRGAWLYLSITNALGPYAYPTMQAVLGIAFIASSRNKKHRKE